VRSSAVPFLVAIVATGAVLAPLASATTMRRLDTRDLTLESSEIVVGQVQTVRPRWSADHKKIFTDVDVAVSRSLKGDGASHLTLTQFGGELDGVKVSVPGGPLFRPGEEALLFVWRDAKGRAQVNGLAQGKFDVIRDAKSGAVTVQRSTPGFAVKDARSLASVRAEEATRRITLDELEREIRSVLAHPEAGR
jgi:hypothetical protein